MKLKGKDAILQRVVFELRYRYGFTYLDKCGRTVNTILRERPEWLLRSDQPNPQNAPLVSIRNGCVFNFGALKYDFSLERPLGKDPLSSSEVEQFIDQVDFISHIVHDHLGLNDFSRIGFRVWYLFPSSTKEESESWLHSLDCYSIPDSLSTAFGGRVEATNLVAVIRGADRSYRVSFNGVERQAQVDLGQEILNVRASALPKDQDKILRDQLRTQRRLRANPEFAAMIDIDTFQEDPTSVDPREFISSSLTAMEKNLRAAIAA